MSHKPYDMLKRTIDAAVAAVTLAMTGPLLLIVALLVYWRLGTPVLFRQTRPGRGGQPFVCLKFRTMTDARDAEGQLLPDDVRLTAFGKILRATSLDELPQLINVVKGDMSLVGPRPLLMDYLPLYSHEQARRHDVRPGITGHAQVNGRNAIDWDTRLKLDVWYVDNRSFWLDAQIVLKSIAIVLGRKGVSREGSPTMPRFEGNKPSKSSLPITPLDQ